MAHQHKIGHSVPWFTEVHWYHTTSVTVIFNIKATV